MKNSTGAECPTAPDPLGFLPVHVLGRPGICIPVRRSANAFLNSPGVDSVKRSSEPTLHSTGQRPENRRPSGFEGLVRGDSGPVRNWPQNPLGPAQNPGRKARIQSHMAAMKATAAVMANGVGSMGRRRSGSECMLGLSHSRWCTPTNEIRCSSVPFVECTSQNRDRSTGARRGTIFPPEGRCVSVSARRCPRRVAECHRISGSVRIRSARA
jgi:hypothetical protein